MHPVSHLANPSNSTLQNQRPLYPTHLSPQLMHSHFTEPILSSHLLPHPIHTRTASQT